MTEQTYPLAISGILISRPSIEMGRKSANQADVDRELFSTLRDQTSNFSDVALRCAIALAFDGSSSIEDLRDFLAGARLELNLNTINRYQAGV